MARPKSGYFTQDGERVPGTTTITGRFKDSGAIIHWAWAQGRDGLDYRETRDAAADAGTLAHDLVEAWLREQDLEAVLAKATSEEQAKQAMSAFQQFQAWQRSTQIVITPWEEPLVSERWRFGGTPDAVGRLNGDFVLLDWKTGSMYMDHLLQLAAYKALWEEHHPEQPITGGFHLCRFARESADFSHHHFGELDDAWEMFKCLRQAYDFDARLKKRVK